jgi:UDP-N-acetylglucosamine 2-epimerase (hydrolysing)
MNKTTRRRICFLTGTRADFGKMKPLIEQIDRSPEFDCRVFVTGMHMMARYGSTVNEVRKAGFSNIYTFINQIDTHSAQMDIVLANTLQGFAQYLREFPVDLIVVHGDRVEALAGAIAGALNNTLVAHVEGGELSGTVDGLIRHAVSKMSHLHFVANEEARTRLIQMGELAESIFVIGSPDIDVMLSNGLPSAAEVRERYAIPFSDYGVFMYHPVTSEIGALRRNVGAVLDALDRSGWNFVAIYPNNDAGTDVVLEALRQYESHPRFRVLPSMRFEYFLTLLRHSRAMIGNSSSGIREAPVYGVPTLNIGTRQMGRYQYPSIVNVSEDSDAILQAMARLPRDVPPSQHFGQGDSARCFMEVLRTNVPWQTSTQKQFADLAIQVTV